MARKQNHILCFKRRSCNYVTIYDVSLALSPRHIPAIPHVRFNSGQVQTLRPESITLILCIPIILCPKAMIELMGRRKLPVIYRGKSLFILTCKHSVMTSRYNKESQVVCHGLWVL